MTPQPHHRTFAILAIVLSSIGVATAQHYPSPPICVGGDCYPNQENYGYYQTRWRRWPTSPVEVVPRPVRDPLIDELPDYEEPRTQPLGGDLFPSFPQPRPEEDSSGPLMPNTDLSPLLPDEAEPMMFGPPSEARQPSFAPGISPEQFDTFDTAPQPPTAPLTLPPNQPTPAPPNITPPDEDANPFTDDPQSTTTPAATHPTQPAAHWLPASLPTPRATIKPTSRRVKLLAPQSAPVTIGPQATSTGNVTIHRSHSGETVRSNDKSTRRISLTP